MTAQPYPCASRAPDGVHWFGASRRLVGDEPDTRYGWLPQHAGGPCIVKALALDLASCASTLLHHEREVLQRLQPPRVPVPELVSHPQLADGAGAVIDGGRLTTRFAGLSLSMLAHAGPRGGPLLTLPETVAAWAAFLLRAGELDEAGALPLDLRPANLVLRLARGTSGQPLLTEPVLIDHAHTVVCGLDLRRPVWINHLMAQVAPELRAALDQDQQALKDTFRRAGAALPGQEGSDARARERSRRMWADYDAPQAVQRLVDAGGLDRGAAMQYAAGMAIEPLLDAAEPALGARLRTVVARLCATEPAARHASLGEAAAALRAALPAVPTAAAGSVPTVDATWLAKAWAAAAAPAPASAAPQPSRPHAGIAGDGATARQPAWPQGIRAPDHVERRGRVAAPAAALGDTTAMAADVFAAATVGASAPADQPAGAASSLRRQAPPPAQAAGQPASQMAQEAPTQAALPQPNPAEPADHLWLWAVAAGTVGGVMLAGFSL